MTAVRPTSRQHLWRLDSLADASRSQEWKHAADLHAGLVDQEQALKPMSSVEKKAMRKGIFSGLKKAMSDALPFSLNSTVKSTRGNLQRIMTSQMHAMPADLPDGEGFDELQDDEFAGFDTVQQQLNSPEIDTFYSFKNSCFEASPDSSGSIDLHAAADAALATAAADVCRTSTTNSASTPNASTAEIPIAGDRKHSSCFAESIPEALRVSSTDSTALPPASPSEQGHSAPNSAGSGAGSRAAGSRQGSIGVRSIPSIRSMRSSKSLGLPRATTLRRMETMNAWWELHEMELAEQQADDTASDNSSEVGTAGRDVAAVTDSRVVLKGTNGKGSSSGRSGSMSASLVKTLASMSVSSWTSGITSRLASLLQTTPTGPVFSTTIKKKAHATVSTDGWTLHLLHVTDTALQPEQRKRHPILMCPGLASSGPGTFDLLPQVSLADFLASQGHDVWVIDIRGNGMADKTSRVDIQQDWNIDDYLVQDVPACIEYVLKHSPTKADKLHWMGHSMGGMLGSGLCSQAGKWSKKLRSVMLVGSGCFGDGSWHCLLKKLVVPIVRFGFPAHITTQGLSLLANTPAALSVFETLFYWCPNMEKPTRKALLATCFNFIPQKLVGQFLESHGSATGLSNARGTFLYADPRVLARCKVPVLGLNGDWDLFCPAAGGERNVMLFGGYKKHVTFGPAHGHQFHYGHFDVVVGRNAQQEVWPHIAEFLETHDTPATVSELWPGLDD